MSNQTTLKNSKTLKDQLTWERNKLQEILDIEEKLNGFLNLDKLIKFVAKKTAEIIQARRCSLMLFDEKTDELYLKDAFGFKDKKFRI